MKEGHIIRRRLTAVGLSAAVAAVLGVAPTGSAKARIPEDPDGTSIQRVSPAVGLTPAVAVRELVTFADDRCSCLLYRVKTGTRYSIPFE
jgi:hypothetical protein